MFFTVKLFCQNNNQAALTAVYLLVACEDDPDPKIILEWRYSLLKQKVKNEDVAAEVVQSRVKNVLPF